MVIYSSLYDNKATIACFFDWCDITFFKNIQIYSQVNFYPFTALAQLESVYLVSFLGKSTLNIIFVINIPNT